MKIYLLFFLLIFISCKKTETPIGQYQIITDDHFKFEAFVPASWDVKKSQDNESFFRFKAISDDKSKAISVYSLRLKVGKRIDKTKLIKMSNDNLNVGQHSNTSKGYVEYYDDASGVHSAVVTKTDKNYGYYIVYQSLNRDFDDFKSYVFSFKSNAPIFSSIWNWISQFLSYFFIPVFFMLIGSLIKESKSKRKWLWLLIGSIITPIIAIPSLIALYVLSGFWMAIFCLLSPFYMIFGYFGLWFHLE